MLANYCWTLKKKAKGIKLPTNVNHEGKIIVFEIFL
jgi:hypothetical protein